MNGLSICWRAARSASGVCGGSVSWIADADGVWWSNCSRCRTGGRAASGEVLELERSKGAA